MTAKIVNVEDDDAEYGRAFSLARESFPRLEALWSEPYEGLRHFMIKVCFQGTRRPIFLWLELTEIGESAYSAEVFESTPELPDVAEGRTISVPKNLALDWLVNDQGVVHGGFTLLVERNRLDGDALMNFDEALMAERWIDNEALN